MKSKLFFLIIAILCVKSYAQKSTESYHGYPINPVPFTSVKVTDAFWGQRLKASR